ncbi:MAG: type II toxin-antitoxin system RelE/ParE family toxin [Albidovulum sp.]|nr:type II toxin-antitoxin system RelE/ParE family toxin [Albidovulum sp.]
MERAGRGLVDADLGGGVIKQRVARRGKGRSGGFRVIAVFRRQECAFFVHGFAKSDRDNLRRRELGALKALADQLLGLDEPGLKAMLANGTISEVICDAKAIRE